jgi:hypothetical protein
LAEGEAEAVVEASADLAAVAAGSAAAAPAEAGERRLSAVSGPPAVSIGEVEALKA